jgi:hypothetical protein
MAFSISSGNLPNAHIAQNSTFETTREIGRSGCVGEWPSWNKNTTRTVYKHMKYRDIEHAVVQSIDRGVWKWSASVAGVVIIGREATKLEAVTAAEKAIDRAIAQKKVRLVPPKAD